MSARATSPAPTPERDGLLSLGELAAEVEAGRIDTVLVAMTDMQGRLQGKRADARYFLDQVVPGAMEGCSYLLAVDVDMRTVDGYALSSWSGGYGDFVLRPDLATLRRVPWHERTACCMADVVDAGGADVAPAPRQVLRRQLERLGAHGLHAQVATELEFMVFAQTYEEAWALGYRDLTPVNLYNVDYSLLGTGRVEPLLGRIRRAMAGAGMAVESAKGECNRGQHEISFRYLDALAKADEHVLFKTGAKEIAAQEGCSLTFMAKFDEHEGSSCHVHFSLHDASGEPAFPADDHGASEVFDRVLAGMLATLPEMMLFYAPNINSYKRYCDASFAPTAGAWGRDNRTCAFRVVGHGPALRIECRVPGGDMNPYLGIAALVAGAVHGLDHALTLEEECRGNAYASGRPRLPTSLRQAAEAFGAGTVTRTAFGDEVVDHYANFARVELEAYDAAVTDWERYRGFERL
ncbi:MAG TPA: glutamine synthetase family protein [Acidimicrobiales bacterium]|nr:glutamine synthetase family protein [Acidimicrobiales bacterium]